MGVPSFFSWLLKNFKNKILIKHISSCNHFYIDANCALHPECNKIKDHFDNISIDKLEKKMFKRVINYLIYLEHYVNAKETMMISVDGVAPLAKMIQQRKRRFKAVDDTKIRNDIKIKYGKTVNDIWHNTVITPSSEFMEKLHNELIKHFKNRKSEITYIYSSYKTHSEGEHKLLQHIKKNVPKDDVVVIYGLDADLIFLAMASGNNNIYLLREAVQLGLKKKKLKYMILLKM